MKIEFILILAVISVILMLTGAGCFSIFEIRHAKRNRGLFRSLTKKPIDADIKLLIVGAILVCLGFLIYLIVHNAIGAVGGAINLREYFK